MRPWRGKQRVAGSVSASVLPLDRSMPQPSSSRQVGQDSIGETQQNGSEFSRRRQRGIRFARHAAQFRFGETHFHEFSGLDLQTGGKRTITVNRLRAGLQTGKPHRGGEASPFGPTNSRAPTEGSVLVNSATLAILSPASLNHLFGLRK